MLIVDALRVGAAGFELCPKRLRFTAHFFSGKAAECRTNRGDEFQVDFFRLFVRDRPRVVFGRF